ncbi:MAG: tRNA (N6-isopentenyl adenosine(37)-C2)-methylthiotransferase MiaB [Bacillota bacterium]
MGPRTSFYIETFGCQMNERDSETISALLAEEGLEPTPHPETADIIILNTCAVRESAEAKVWSRLGKLHALSRENEPVFVLAGCMAQLPETLERIKKKVPYVKVVSGPGNIHRIPELAKKARSDEKRRLFAAVSPPRSGVARDESTQILPEGLPRKNIPGVSAFVTIMYGCDNFCSYCIVPYVRGPQVSRLPEDVIRESRDLVERGYKEITLLGQNVNAFGLDFGAPGQERLGFAGLLRELNRIQGLYRIRYFTSHPRDFTKEMVDAVAACEKVCEHFHLPVQSGSDRILRAMNRGYSKGQYLDLASYIRETVPGASITTDIIVGFPGETEEDFQETLDVVRRVRFDGAFTFIFSPRKGTAAAKMKGQILRSEKSERLQRLVDVQSEITLERNKAMVGEKVEVLVEERDQKDPDVWRGRTRTNKMVLCEGDPGSSLLGCLVEVEVREAGLWYLKGQVKRVLVN